MRLIEWARDVLIVSLLVSFVWLGIYVSVLDAALKGVR
jgi:hypothetical protein